MSRILVIDDDVFFRNQLVRLLGGEGFECDHVGTDEEARRLASQRAYAYVFLDLCGDSGALDLGREAFCSELRGLNPGAVLVGMTGLVLSASQGFNLGKAWLDDFIQKGGSSSAYLAPLRARRHAPRSQRRFRVALSYAAAQEGGVIEDVARRLAHEFGRRQVFYAPYHQVELGRRGANERLQRVFSQEADLVVVFVSDAYVKSPWCAQEWKAVTSATDSGALRDVMLFQLEGPNVGGLLAGMDIAIDMRQLDAERAAAMIIARVDASDG